MMEAHIFGLWNSLFMAFFHFEMSFFQLPHLRNERLYKKGKSKKLSKTRPGRFERVNFQVKLLALSSNKRIEKWSLYFCFELEQGYQTSWVQVAKYQSVKNWIFRIRRPEFSSKIWHFELLSGLEFKFQNVKVPKIQF